MVKLRDIPSQAFPSVGFYVVSKQWKIQESFFKTYNVIPDWINCNFTFGTLNVTICQWSGAVGAVLFREMRLTMQYLPLLVHMKGVRWLPSHQ